jgi:hypothetical protein
MEIMMPAVYFSGEDRSVQSVSRDEMGRVCQEQAPKEEWTNGVYTSAEVSAALPIGSC